MDQSERETAVKEDASPGLSDPDPVDVHVGGRLAALRREAGLTQADLGAAVGVTFQQWQKYERGTNRISASRLWAATGRLGCAIADVFPDRGATLPGTGGTHHAIIGSDRFASLAAADQKLVMALVERLAGTSSRR